MSRRSRERWASRHDRSDRTAQAFGRAASGLQPISVSSQRGAVTVDLDARGTVTRVTVNAQWKQECQPPELGTLVLQTLGEGQAKRFGQWAEATEAGEPEPARPMTDPGYRTRVVKGSRGDFAVRDAIRKVGGLNGALDELIDSMKAVATAEHRGRSSSGHVTATANGRSEVVGIDFEVDWLDSAHSFNIGREATEAINDSVRRAASSTLDEVVADSRLGRLRQLLVEPAEAPKAPPSNNNEGGTQA